MPWQNSGLELIRVESVHDKFHLNYIIQLYTLQVHSAYVGSVFLSASGEVMSLHRHSCPGCREDRGAHRRIRQEPKRAIRCSKNPRF